MKGQCSCGEVVWESEAAVAWSCYCHCADCRRACAAPVTAFFGLPHEAVNWGGTEPRIYRSSEGVERLFCGTCGTQMAYRTARDPVNIHLYTATLEDPGAVPPRFHVFHSEHLTWLHLQDGLPRYAKTAG
ncbi:GFA family protein [Cribrihabitans neustonicus]|uniref:GFA family protein n=1 Tax=Cribrihabitans neustonicus TaxID=1429085 RepID=UPI003B5CFD19